MFFVDNILIINSGKNKDFKLNKEKMLEFKVKSLTQLIREYSDEHNHIPNMVMFDCRFNSHQSGI